MKDKIKSAFTIYIFLKRRFNCFVIHIPRSKKPEVMCSLSNSSYPDMPQQEVSLPSLHPWHEVPACPQTRHGPSQESLSHPCLPRLNNHQQPGRRGHDRGAGLETSLFPIKIWMCAAVANGWRPFTVVPRQAPAAGNEASTALSSDSAQGA